MITATEQGAYLGYTIGFDLPLTTRTRVATLAAAPDDVYATRELDRIIATHRPTEVRGLRTFPGQPDYVASFRSNFIDGATAPGPHRKLIDA